MWGFAKIKSKYKQITFRKEIDNTNNTSILSKMNNKDIF